MRNKQELKEYLNAINKVAIVLIFDNDGKVIYVNDFLLEVSKYLEEELLNKDYKLTYHKEISKVFLEEQWEDIQSNKKWSGKIKHLSKNNSTFYTNTTILPVIKKGNEEKRFVSVNFLTTEIENERRNYKKKVLYNLQETKHIYTVAQDKIEKLKIEIDKYEDYKKYKLRLESKQKLILKLNNEIKKCKEDIVKQINIREELVEKISVEIFNRDIQEERSRDEL